MANEATAIYFDGSSDSIDIPDHENFNFGTGDWCVEGWVYATTLSGDQALWNSWSTSGTSDAIGSVWLLRTTGGASLVVNLANSGTGSWNIVSGAAGNAGDSGFDLVVNKWYHVVLQFNGEGYQIFVNGMLGFMLQTTARVQNVNRGVRFGLLYSGPYAWQGYMDALRISRTALYGNFDIPTTQLNTWQTAGRGQNALLPHHTKLLIQANSTTTTSSTIYDQSYRGRTVNVTGCVHSQGSTLFGNTAIFFDGDNDFLQIDFSNKRNIENSNRN